MSHSAWVGRERYACGMGGNAGRRVRTVAMCGAVGLASVAAAAPPVPFPNPVIMEALFAVPADEALDPNKDGVRDATGDEFVEIMNPHNKPIDLAGFVIADKTGVEKPGDKRGVRFVFPSTVLAPGAVAVVFNGAAAGKTIPGEVGTSAKAAGPNAQFGGALVFTMENTAPSRAFANAADLIALVDPKGAVIDVVTWGRNAPPAPKGALRSATVRAVSTGSVQRVTAEGELRPHAEIDGTPCSPGVIPAVGGGAGAGGGAGGGGPGR